MKKNVPIQVQIIKCGTPAYALVVALRQIILRNPLGLYLTTTDLENDKNDHIIAAIKNGVVIGCCHLTPQPNKVLKLRQMAVAAEHQGNKIGAGILQYADKVGVEFGYNNITMHARLTAVDFYKINGYKVVGKQFDEVGIPHILMKKMLEVAV